MDPATGSSPVQALIIAQINAYCVDCRWFWVAGLARETWPVLQYHLDKLHPWAVMAVTHYREETSA